MKGLREKFQKNGGFTLIEMLIVVAIIAILIAVSIPLVGSALEKARDATDQANERAAKAEAVIMYLDVGDKKITYTNGSAELWYDAVNGKLLTADEAKTQIKADYGQCTEKHSTGYISDTAPHTEKIIKVTITEDDGTIAITWDSRPK